MSETPERDALDHIMRVAREGIQPTRRLDWIALRAQYALEGKQWSRDIREQPRNSVLKMQKENHALREELERARAFITDLFDITGWPYGGDIDLFTVQDLAVKHGILTEEKRTEPCGDNCQCAEYHGDMSDGVPCYRKPEWMMNADQALREANGG